MKTKQMLCFLVTIITIIVTAQTTTKDILGIWKMTDMRATDWYSINFETKKVTIEKKVINLGGTERAAKMKIDMESKLEPTYFVFSDNNTYVSLQNDKLIKGDFKISKLSGNNYYSLTLSGDSKSESLLINLEKKGNSKLFTVITDMKEETQGFSDSEVEYNYKMLSSGEILALKDDPKYKKFENERISFKKEKEKDDLATKESQLRNAREDAAKAERLRKEETKTGKLYLSNINIIDAAETVRKKFNEGRFQDIVKNENIKSDYSTDNNLYKSTLIIKNTKSNFISDYKGKKYFNIVVASENSNTDGVSNDVLKLYYEYENKFQEWTKKNGNFKKYEGSDRTISFISSDFKIELHVYYNGNVNQYNFDVTFSQP